MDELPPAEDLGALCRERGYHSVWEGDGGHCDDCGEKVDVVGNVSVVPEGHCFACGRRSARRDVGSAHLYGCSCGWRGAVKTIEARKVADLRRWAS